MKAFASPDIRNVALLGHGHTGKTTLTSSLLFIGGAEKRLGSVDEGTATTDFDAEEISRKFSLQTTLAHVEWKSKKINILDTPGHDAFVADAKSGVAVADAALLLVEGVSGVQVLTPRLFRFAEEYALPTLFLVTKLDRERASFERVLGEIEGRFGRTAVPLQLPIGEEADFEGVVDLLTMKAHVYAKDGSGKVTISEIPESLKSQADERHASLVEMVAESDEQLMESYFEAGDLDAEQLAGGIRTSVRERKIFPVLCSAAGSLIGVRSLMDALVEWGPAPGERGEMTGDDGTDDNLVARAVDSSEPVSLFVFKTIADPFAGRLSLFRVCSGTVKGDSAVINMRTGNPERLGHVNHMQGKQVEPADALHAGDLGVLAKLKETQTNDTLSDPNAKFRYPPTRYPEAAISYAVEPKSKGDEEKIGGVLHKLTEEDPVLRVGRDAQTHELLVSGASQVHVEVAITKMKKKFGVDAVLKQPKVPYLETIRKKVGPIEGKHKKQSGGRGQFGVCVIEMEPLGRGKGFEFVDKIFGGSIPQTYRPAVQKGIQETAAKGPLVGCPVTDFRVTLLDGKYHNVDSSEMAFKIAGSIAFQEALKQAKPVLLEPVMGVEITAPEEFMGDIMGDLSSRRGKPQGMEPQGAYQVIRAQVPMAEMLTYASTLKSITSDRGSYHMEFDHYAEVPVQVQQQVTAELTKAKEARA